MAIDRPPLTARLLAVLRQPSSEPARADTLRTKPSSAPSSDGRSVPAPTGPTPTEQLIARIIAAGGTLTLTPDRDPAHRKLEERLQAWRVGLGTYR